VTRQAIFESLKQLSPSLSFKEHGCFLSETLGNGHWCRPYYAKTDNRDVSNVISMQLDKMQGKIQRGTLFLYLNRKKEGEPGSKYYLFLIIWLFLIQMNK
jgi:hypothetical protein